MKSKSLQPAAAISSACAALLLLSSGWLPAQSPIPSPSSSPKPPKPKVGHVRFWNAMPTSADTVLDLMLSGVTPERLLKSAGPSNFYSGYVNLLPGNYILRVFKHDDRQNVIKSFDLPLHDKGYHTLLATQMPGEPIEIELVDDTPDPAKAPINRVTVRQLCPNITGMISAPGNIRSNTLAFGKTQTLEGLPNGIVTLHLQATKVGTSAVRVWDSEADFRISHHGTMFIVNDVYGRLSPRLSMDGPSPAEEAETAEEAKAAEASKPTP